MDLIEAESLARGLMQTHGLQEWAFRFDRAIRRFGLCDRKKHLITLSRTLTEMNETEVVRDTILHEIAHALNGNGHGHGQEWKAQAIALGCRPVRCYDNAHVKLPTVKPRKRTWSAGKCPGCSRVIYRRQRRNIACSWCGKGAYKKRFAFKWRRLTADERRQIERLEQRGEL